MQALQYAPTIDIIIASLNVDLLSPKFSMFLRYDAEIINWKRPIIQVTQTILKYMDSN